MLKPWRGVRYNPAPANHLGEFTFPSAGPIRPRPVAAEVVMALPVPARSDPYHGWLLRAFLALVAVLLFALALSKT